MESSTLAPVLSYILTKMVERNDKIPLDDSKRTVFHAQKAPLISLHRYLERVLSFAPCSNSCFIIALIYIDRIIQHSDFILNSLSVHRMLITSVMLATKFFDDETFNNQYYAKVGGLQVNEVNQLENKFLSLIDFSLTIRSELFDRYHCELVKHAKVNGNAKSCIPSLHSKLSYEERVPCQKISDKNAKPLSRSTGSIMKPTGPTIHPVCTEALTCTGIATPQPTTEPTCQTAAQIRTICETLVSDTVKNTAIQSQLMGRVTELLSAEEKLHHRLPPSSIKTMCAKLALEHNLPPSFIAQAALQAERLERDTKDPKNNDSSSNSGNNSSSSAYETGFDYTARDMILTTSDNNTSTSNSTSTNLTNASTSSSSTSSSSSSSNTNGNGGEGGNSGVSTTGAVKGRGANFSMCTPSYPSNSHMYGNRLLGVN